MEHQIDYSALTEPIDKADLTRSTETANAEPGSRQFSRGGWIAVMVMMSVLVAMLSTFFVGMIAMVVTGEVHWGSFTWGGSILVGGATILLALLYWRSLVGLYATSIEGFTNSTRYRLRRFATANGLRFFTVGDDPGLPGMMFSGGIKSSRMEHLRSATGDDFEYGNMTRMDAGGSKPSYTDGGYLAIKLKTSLPNIVLDARRNNSFFNDSALQPLDRTQVLSLEGDFDKHFTLYCPEGYERDALYIFTPDLMALLIDNAADFDVEIVDNWLLVYQSKHFDLRHPIVHKRLLGIVDNVAAKALSQTERYRDERHGSFRNRGVAPAGRRLATTISISGVIIGILVVGFPIVGLFLDF